MTHVTREGVIVCCLRTVQSPKSESPLRGKKNSTRIGNTPPINIYRPLPPPQGVNSEADVSGGRGWWGTGFYVDCPIFTLSNGPGWWVVNAGRGQLESTFERQFYLLAAIITPNFLDARGNGYSHSVQLAGLHDILKFNRLYILQISMPSGSLHSPRSRSFLTEELLIAVQTAPRQLTHSMNFSTGNRIPGMKRSDYH